MTSYRIAEIRSLTLGTDPVCVPVRGLSFLAENNSSTATVYLKEQRCDGVPADGQNGWILAPGERTALPLVALDLSLAASGADTDVRVMILDSE